MKSTFPPALSTNGTDRRMVVDVRVRQRSDLLTVADVRRTVADVRRTVADGRRTVAPDCRTVAPDRRTAVPNLL